jgi:hypothetical protein
MKNFFLVLIFFLFSSTSLLAEYRLEPANCTLKKKSNCGAYLYNGITGATYFCDLEKCTEIMPAIEEASEAVGGEKTKKSKIPKKKKSKIPKFKKKKSE